MISAFFGSLKQEFAGYNSKKLLADMMAGLTVCAVALPLALHGVLAKKDGTVEKVVLGEDPTDPVLGISDILPHLGKDQAVKPMGEAFTGEDLNVCVGSIPEKEADSEAVKKHVLALLKENDADIVRCAFQHRFRTQARQGIMAWIGA